MGFAGGAFRRGRVVCRAVAAIVLCIRFEATGGLVTTSWRFEKSLNAGLQLTIVAGRLMWEGFGRRILDVGYIYTGRT